ncbi:hypothetical protein B0H11DRAFT_2123048 [Mycena galericulata]|nr:hypothetical protein B0H11DRAFT_2123048 [Mycena galericulata]
MTSASTEDWAQYEDDKRRNVPEFASPLPRDLELLFERLRNTTDHRSRPFPSLNDVSSMYPTFDDLYSAHCQFFEAVAATIRGYYYYLACRRGWDPRIPALFDDPDTALQSFTTEDDRVRKSIDTVAASWKDARHRISYELRVQLRMPVSFDWVVDAESVVLPWLPDSQRHMLLNDVPNIVKQAQLHLERFEEVYLNLKASVKQNVWGAGSATERLLLAVIMLFTRYKFGLAVSTGLARSGK